jgi:GT2 family glycosyltransferase
MDVSIIIVSWRVKNLVKNCLDSIYRETTNLSLEVFVVDNASNDGTVEMVANLFPQVHVIASQQNLGFARACNQAIKESTGEAILLLNPDTEITGHAIEKTFQFMQRTQDAGIVGCRIVNADNSLQPSARHFPDFFSHVIILFKLHNFFPNFFPIRYYYMRGWEHTETRIVDQIMGAFFMIRRPVLKAIGLLDTHFYIWYEEVDFCKRALEAGWKTYFYAEATIRHQKGQSFKQEKPLRLQAIFNRSLLYYFFKHKSIFEYCLLLLLLPLSILLALAVQLTGIKKKRNDL